MSEQDNERPIRWCLDVTCAYDDHDDDAVVKAVGRDYGDSGAGFGQRDLGFWFDNEVDAKHAEHRVLTQCPFVRSTNIWNTGEEDE
jgi:hypothetical protein